ncbi:MAG: hypothetical protein JXJ17_17310 [Anaerolineae bacterium]|nr:hypothetical protein [Anaerolineae bacterium]
MFSPNAKHRRSILLTASAALLILVLACNIGAVAGPPTPTPAPTATPVDEEAALSEAGVTLEILNQLPDDVCQVYLSYVTAPNWGVNRLEGSVPIAPGSVHEIVLPPNTYDLQVITCPGQVFEVRDLAITQDMTFPLVETAAVVEAQPSEKPDTEAIIVWITEPCLLPAIAPGDPFVVRTPWIAATVDIAEQNADQINLVLSIDGKVQDSIEPVRHPGVSVADIAELGCFGISGEYALVYWDFAIDGLEEGSHTFEIEYIFNGEIFDGYNTYGSDSLDPNTRTLVIGEVEPGETTTCGDDRCSPGESYDLCPADCNPPVNPGPCGDGVCEESESVDSGDFCPYDCGWCGDGFCTDPELFNDTCPADCD